MEKTKNEMLKLQAIRNSITKENKKQIRQMLAKEQIII